MAVNLLEGWLKNRWVQYSLRLAFALLITVLLSPFKLDLLEYTSYDLRMQLTPGPRTSGDIVLIPIEFDTMRKLKRDPEALDWAVVLQKLGQMKPAHIVSNILPSQIQGSYDDLSFLAETAAHLPFTIGQDDLPKTGLTRLDPLPPPFENLPTDPFPKTADTRVGPKDGATRRLILTYENQFTLHPRLAQKFNGIHKQQDYAGVFPLLDSTQMLIRYREKGSYPQIKFIDVLEGNINPEMIRGKIVLIGKDDLESAVNYVTTPLSKKLLALSQLEMHANILDTLILNESPHFLPDLVTWLLTFMISLLTISIVLTVRPGKGLLILGATLIVFLAASLVLFATLNWVVPLTHPLLAVFICYYFVIPYRLIIENRRSWEYYQKNKLLTQVEEMKSNFMRMMSHDLKTPLARIQGMAELIGKDTDTLSETQKMALDTIDDSSQELMEFIGSILSLSRISAKEMKLQLRSRDINQVLRNVIRRCEHLAVKKHIEVVAELEPLFSIKLDEDLLKTVFTNLLENAIKYSPEGTKVLVSSEEVNNELVVQIADQGRGIALEEISHIFERFYRARNSRADTPGNGLGLFLAKYFVELHNGRIDVESELTKGSTFSVRLPMNLDNEPEHPEQSGGLYV
jgi:signal transduction histidine kinase